PVGPNGRGAHGLIADVAVPVGPHHVLRGGVAVAAGVAELLPIPGLVHAQAAEIGRTAGIEPGGANGVGLVARAILVHDRAVAGVFELHRDGRRAFDWNPLTNDL